MANLLVERRYVLISIAAILLTGFLLARDAIARLAWERLGAAGIALVLVRHDADLAMAIGNHHFGGGKYNLDTARRAYGKALAINPGILWGHYQLARIHFVRGYFPLALEEINAELSTHPTNLRSLYVRGLIHGYRGDLEAAETDFRRFTQWAPGEWGGYNDLAWIQTKRGKYREAEQLLNDALRKVPGAEANPWLWNSLGVARLNLQNRAGAREAFEKARDLASALTTDEWRRAYPGNDPGNREGGLAEFKSAIAENLRRASSDVDK